MAGTRSSVECADCGFTLEHNPDDPAARPPCPQCGGTKRSYSVTGEPHLTNYTLDNFIYVLLVTAIVLFFVGLVSGRRTV